MSKFYPTPFSAPCKSITAEAKNIPDFMAKEVLEPLISAVRGGLGIEGEGGSSVFKEIGETAINSLFEGLDVDESTVTERVGGTISTIMTSFNFILLHFQPLVKAKEFAWIGEMITKGLAAGMDGSQKEAVASAQDLAEAVIEGADGVDPTISMETAVDGLDDVLTTFSDKVANSFADMIGRLEAIVTGSSCFILLHFQPLVKEKAPGERCLPLCKWNHLFYIFERPLCFFNQ